MKEVNVNGTLVWYYYICKRQAWLMARNINPNQDNPLLDLGRFIQEHTYERDKRKEVVVGNIIIDVIKKGKKEIVVGEVKKSSKFKESAKMQLAFYLWEFKKIGIDSTGVLMFPKEKERVEVVLDDELEKKVEKTAKEILRIIYKEKPQPAEKIGYCKNCAYSEFCWA
ncbi:CRISPR-associated exonuclease, Cas4 family [Anaerobranca californiensis DSM 14826]|uniref:CRISPR-associated exonuclease Cas4 n=1 Tax=Anaerobranca californiensis DSM 14826 TaxID=1120989 RepID=A0A1M6RZR4_9FIRM|nr:CRISPR-associated protein Cas4 [Anaerobranca californiensis]SHK37951.1 CRISPR-associated exonuclease, Cas4 family [Anaerobranca californiensis DSM 14826]